MDKGTITNASGEFSIMVPPNATLIVSFCRNGNKKRLILRDGEILSLF